MGETLYKEGDILYYSQEIPKEWKRVVSPLMILETEVSITGNAYIKDPRMQTGCVFLLLLTGEQGWHSYKDLDYYYTLDERYKPV